jgi:hypothetical protein
MGTENFVITGYGRSGTAFLSKMLNMSDKWTVLHEPRGRDDEGMYKNGKEKDQILKIYNSFSEPYYGEVNSYLRYYLNYFNSYKKGILIREPREIITSVANRKPISKLKFYVDDLHYYYNLFLALNDVQFISFQRMITDLDYLREVGESFGITDVIYNEDHLKKKINVNKKIRFSVFEDLPDEIKDYYNTKFKNIYNYGNSIYEYFTF